MLMTIIKAVTMVYPFIREVILGKHADDKDFKWIKVSFIFIAIASIIANIYLTVATLNLGKDKIKSDVTILDLKADLNKCKSELNQCKIDKQLPPIKQETPEVFIKPSKPNKRKQNNNNQVMDILNNANRY